ncbi:MAG: sulfatase-like hydrolase/transferase [Planctomycetaceae bacterium]
MPQSRFLLALSIILAGWPGTSPFADARAAERAAQPPNIVLIMADDLGIECLRSYGGRSYETPHLDRLAGQGLRFTHCFANPYCSPTRAQILTGRYPLHTGIERVIYLPDQHREFLDPTRETSFANLLKDAGYRTAMAGKWQLSFLHERDTVPGFGFDEYQCWQIFVEGTKTSRYAEPVFRRNGEIHRFPDRYGPDVNADFLIDFIRRNKERPFLAYYSMLLPHFPWEPTPDSGDPLKPSATPRGDKRYFKDMVAYMDKTVGRIVREIDEIGLGENTLILFTADNGTEQGIVSEWADGEVVRRVPGGKATMTEAGTRVPLIARWTGTIEPGRVSHDLIDLSDILPTLVELGGAKLPAQPINGRSFAPQLFGKPGNPRATIHASIQGRRHVRGRDYTLDDRGHFRPIEKLGEKAAAPLKAPLTAEQARARALLESALDDARTFSR